MFFSKHVPTHCTPYFSCSNQNNQTQHQQLQKHTAEARHAAAQWQMQLHQMQDKSKQPPNVLVVAV
jgi:hypothetical protein